MTQEEKKDQIVFILSEHHDEYVERYRGFGFYPGGNDPYWQGFFPTEWDKVPVALSEVMYNGNDNDLYFIFAGGDGASWEEMPEVSQNLMYEKFMGLDPDSR